MTPPLITALPTEDGTYRLYCTVRGQLDIAGERLFHSKPPWPEVAWTSDTEELANAEARKLQRYLDETYGKRGPSKTKLRQQGE